ncbi:hypothetical protein PENTCL1PPCAC_16898, partial [Pristionchus entomophagus]
KNVDPPELIVLSEVYGISFVTLHFESENPPPKKRKWRLLLTVNSIDHPTSTNNKHSILKCAPMPRMISQFP